MKKTIVNICLIAVCLMSNLLICAQTPSDNSDTGDLQGGDVSAPIDDYIPLMALTAVCFGYFFIQKRAKEEV